MPTPSVGDLYARQLFSFPVPVVQKLVLHATEPEAVLKDLDGVFGSTNLHFDTPLIVLVLLLVRHRLPTSPTPALDFAWETRGSEATSSDMEIYWDKEKKAGGALIIKREHVEGSVPSAAGAAGLGPSPLPIRIHADLPPTSTSDLPHREPPTPDSPSSATFSATQVDVRRVEAPDDADMSIRASFRSQSEPPRPNPPQRKTSLSTALSNGPPPPSRKPRKFSGVGEAPEDAFKVAMKKRMDESREAAERRVFVQL